MAWKKQPLATGGGDNGLPKDYSQLTFANLGITATGSQGRTADSRQSEYVKFNEYACVKMAVNERFLSLNVLNADCEIDTWWVMVVLRGSDLDDIQYTFREDRAQANGQ